MGYKSNTHFTFGGTQNGTPKLAEDNSASQGNHPSKSRQKVRTSGPTCILSFWPLTEVGEDIKLTEVRKYCPLYSILFCLAFSCEVSWLCLRWFGYIWLIFPRKSTMTGESIQGLEGSDNVRCFEAFRKRAVRRDMKFAGKPRFNPISIPLNPIKYY